MTEECITAKERKPKMKRSDWGCKGVGEEDEGREVLKMDREEKYESEDICGRRDSLRDSVTKSLFPFAYKKAERIGR
jgi:hypothetical protein